MELLRFVQNGEETFYADIGKGKFLPAKVVWRAASQDISTLLAARGRNFVLDLQLYPAQYRLFSFDAQGNATASNSVAMTPIVMYTVAKDLDNDGRQDLAVLSTDKGATYLTVYMQR